MDSNAQHVRLSDQIVNLYGRHLSVVSGSGKLGFKSGLVLVFDFFFK